MVTVVSTCSVVIVTAITRDPQNWINKVSIILMFFRKYKLKIQRIQMLKIVKPESSNNYQTGLFIESSENLSDA